MKKIIIAAMLVIGISSFANAQRVSVRLNFPSGVVVEAPGRPPYAGAVWIAPEWRWERGRYVSVPGYWARPAHRHAVYVRGYWRHSYRGYVWVPGRWR